MCIDCFSYGRNLLGRCTEDSVVIWMHLFHLGSVILWYLLLWLFSCSVVSNSLQPRGTQHTRLPWPSLSPEFAQTHVCWVGDAIHPSQLLSSPSPLALYLSQHQSLFQWVGSLHQVTEVLEFQLPMNTQDWSPLEWTDWICLQSKGLWRIFSNTTVQKHQFFYSIVIGTVASQYLTLYTNDEYTIKYLWYILLQSYS